MIHAIPPSHTSHVERGQVGRALVEALAESQSGLALQVCHQAIASAGFFTSMSGFALEALANPEAASTSELAQLGLNMMAKACPYPADQSAAALATLGAIEDVSEDRQIKQLSQTALGRMQKEQGAVKAAIGTATLEKILKMEKARLDVEALLEDPTFSDLIEVEFEEDRVTVGDHSVAISSVTEK